MTANSNYSGSSGSAMNSCAGWNAVQFTDTSAQTVSDFARTNTRATALYAFVRDGNGVSTWRSWQRALPPYANTLTQLTPGMTLMLLATP